MSCDSKSASFLLCFHSFGESAPHCARSLEKRGNDCIIYPQAGKSSGKWLHQGGVDLSVHSFHSVLVAQFHGSDVFAHGRGCGYSKKKQQKQL